MDRGMLGLVIRLSRLVGITPYMSRAKDGVSKPLFILGLIIVTFSSSYILYIVISLLMTNVNGNQRKNMMVLYILRIFVYFFLVTNAMIAVTTSSKRIVHMVRNLEKLDKIHEKICTYRSAPGDRRTDLLLQIYASGIFAVYISDCFLRKKFIDYPVFQIIITMIHLWVDLSALQVILFSEKVLAAITNINQILHQLLIDRKEEEEYMNNKTIKPKLAFVYSVRENEEFKNLRRNIYRQRNVSDSVTSECVEYTIRRLSKCYMIICEIIRDTTNVNGPLLLVALLTHMLHLETFTYMLVAWMSYENSFGLETIFLIYNDLFLMLGLFLLVDTFHRTHAEMKRTELLIRRLKYENDPPMAVNNELDLFQRILVLQETSYSPFDMCTLDRSLLVKVFGILISYLVIMLTHGPRLDLTANKALVKTFRQTREY